MAQAPFRALVARLLAPRSTDGPPMEVRAWRTRRASKSAVADFDTFLGKSGEPDSRAARLAGRGAGVPAKRPLQPGAARAAMRCCILVSKGDHEAKTLQGHV